MADHTQHDDRPWEPKPIPAEDFHQPEARANINRAPHDQIAGVIYKRALNIKAVRYDEGQGAGGKGQSMVVRWLFSELSGTEENLLADAIFAFLHDVRVAPGAASGEQSAEAEDRIYYVIAGVGMLYHRPTPGSPIVARPLRPGDACWVRAGEYHHLENKSEETTLRLIVVGLDREKQRNVCVNV
ncbi:MAG: cupin domain-containing protein [Anaerolineales bacterium]